MTNKEIKSKIIALAQALHAEKVYDLSFNISYPEFFKFRFSLQRSTEKKLTKLIYKLK